MPDVIALVVTDRESLVALSEFTTPVEMFVEQPEREPEPRISTRSSTRI